MRTAQAPHFCIVFSTPFLNRFCVPTWFQKSTQIDKKNRCQDASHLGLRFLIDFGSMFAPNLYLLDFKKYGFPYETSFLKIAFRS